MNIVDLKHIELRGRTANNAEVVVRGQWKSSCPSTDPAWLETIEAFEKLAECLAKWQVASEPVAAFE